MNLYILNNNYEKVGYIDHADSILWNKKYNDDGECEIYLPCDIEAVEILQNGYYVYRSDDDMFCQITSVEIETDLENGDYIIATAKDISRILSGRIVRWEITFSGTVYEFIKKLITDNIISPAQEQRKIENFVFVETADFTDTITMNVFTDDLLETIKSICKTYNYGYRLSYNIESGNLEFKLYNGTNRATISSNGYVEFSPTYSNIISSKYKEDHSNYKNLCYVGYKNSSDQTHLLSVYNTATEPIGEDRKEIYVDGTGVSRDITEAELFNLFENVSIEDNNYYAFINDTDVHVATKNEDKITVTDYTYLILIRILGLNTLTENAKTQTFVGEVDTIDSYEYKVDYNLGDTIKVINEYGIEAEAYITEIMESEDNEDGYVVEPVFQYLN